MKRGVLLLWVGGLACSFDSAAGGSPEPGGDTSTTADTTTGPTSDSTTLGTGSSQGDTTNSSTSAPSSETSTHGETTAPGEGSSGDATDGPGESGDASSSGGASFELCDAGDPNLRACYDFADPNSGVLRDLSMYGNDGTITSVGVEGGPFGDAVRPSNDAEVSVPDSDSMDLTGPLTWEAWVYFDSFPGGGRVGVMDNEAQYSIAYYPGQGMRCNCGGHSAFAPEVPLGQWLHVACVYNDVEITAWIDGRLAATAGTGNPASGSNDAPLSIGDMSPGFTEPMDGLVGGVRIWSGERTEAQILEAAAVLD